MADLKFEQSCKRFRQSMQDEILKRRKIIEIDSPYNRPKVEVISIKSNLPKLEIKDLIKPKTHGVDVLKDLILELGIDEDDQNMVYREVAQEVLPQIQSIQPGKRTRFQVKSSYGPVEVYIRSSLDVWLIFEKVKLVFPKPRTDVSLVPLNPQRKREM